MDKPYKCEYCEDKFSQKSLLVCHEKWHRGEDPYQCNDCGKTFKKNNFLKNHRLICNKDKSYKCKYCEMDFSDKATLLKHLKTHTEEKPYKCTECEKAFKRNDQLQAHYRLHTGEKPFQCSHCEKSFALRSSLIYHLKTLQKQYPCKQCNRSFSQNSHLKRHLQKTHTKQEESNQSNNCEKNKQKQFPNNSVMQKSIHINYLKTHTNSSGVWLGRVKPFHNKLTDCSSNRKLKSKSDNILDKNGDQSSIPLFCDDPSKVILWFQQNKLLKSAWSCGSCCKFMNWSETSRSKDVFEWICQTKDCKKYQQGVCIKSGSFFDNSCVTLPDWFDIMYLWSENVKAKVSSDLVDISHKQIMDCYASFREICWAYFIENPIKLGGPGTIIEIDVTSFPGKSDTNQDKPPIMVLGIIDSNSIPLNGYMEIVESSDAATLLPKLLNVVKPGSIIYTKDSKEFEKVQGIIEIGTIVNHSIIFMNLNTSEHVTNIGTFWDRHHNNINDIHGFKQIDQNSYLQELMWRDRFNDHSFKIFCQQISDQYPL